MKTRIVEVISEDKRYRKERYPAVIPEDPVHGSYINGLEYRPGDDDRIDFLTKDELTKKKEVAPKARMERFPPESIIGSDDVVQIFHGMKLNITPKDGKEDSRYPGDYVYPADFAKYKLLHVLPNVAKTKGDYNRERHHFYLLDREYEAAARMTKRQLSFKAQELLLKDATIERLKKIAVLISFKTKNYQFGDIEKLSVTQVQDKLFEIAENDPQFIMQCDASKHKDVGKEMFIVDALEKGILKKKGVDYVDTLNQDSYAGSDLLQLIKYVEADEQRLLKWKAYMKNNE